VNILLPLEIGEFVFKDDPYMHVEKIAILHSDGVYLVWFGCKCICMYVCVCGIPTIFHTHACTMCSDDVFCVMLMHVCIDTTNWSMWLLSHIQCCL